MMQGTETGAVVRQALVVDEGLAETTSAAARSVRAPGGGAASPQHRGRRGLLVRGRARGRRLRLRHSLHPAQLDAGRQRRRLARAGDRAVARRAQAQRQGSDLPDGEPRARGHGQRRSGDAGRRVHLDARRHRDLHRRPRAGARSSATSQTLLPPLHGRAGALRPRTASTPGPRPVTRAASRSSSRRSVACSSTSTARTCSAPTWASSAARSARCSATAVRSARASAMPRASSARDRSLLGAERHLGVQSRHHVGLRRRRRDRAVRSQLPQVDRAGAGDHRRHPGVPEPDAQSLRHHRPDSAGATRARRRSRRSSPPIRWPRPRPASAPVYSVVTNCTYDGMCYNAADARGAARQERGPHPLRRGVVRLRALQPDVPRSLRDARRPADASRRTARPSSPRTRPTSCSRRCRRRRASTSATAGAPSITAASTRRTASQASTSPLYALIASNDVAAAMMDGPAGQALTQETHRRGGRLPAGRGARTRRSSWRRRTGSSRRGMPRRSPTPRPASASRSTRHRPSCSRPIRTAGCCIPARAGTASRTCPDGWCMLDPIKFGIVCPGMKDDGELDEKGIPADIVTAYLGRHGIVPSRTTDHMVLFLFSIGVTKGKWGTLLNTLLDFKVDYDRNAPLAEVLPGVVAAARRIATPARASRISATRCGRTCARASRVTGRRRPTPRCPRPKMTPRRAFQKLMAGDAEKVPLDEMADRVVAVGVIPYPPGIPIVMPGESIGPTDGPWLTYLRTLQEYGPSLPGLRQGSGGHRRARRRLPRLLREGLAPAAGRLQQCMRVRGQDADDSDPVPQAAQGGRARRRRRTRRSRALLERLSRPRTSRSRSATAIDRDVSEDADVGAYIASVDGDRREQARTLGTAQSAHSASRRRSGRSRIRTGSPTSRCWA